MQHICFLKPLRAAEETYDRQGLLWISVACFFFNDSRSSELGK
jgi:hypothetical protein